MPTCPRGHSTVDEEYCDECGLAMNGAPAAASVAAVAPVAAPTMATTCPACDTPLDGRFCEACGHDSLAAPPPRPTTVAPPEPQPTPGPSGTVPSAPTSPAAKSWTATVSADRKYYESVIAIGGPDADSIAFPPYCPDRFFPLNRKEITIGRHSATRGIHPDIDLTGPPEDPGVSHLHAVLITQPSGELSIVDLGSSNGTTLNESTTSLRPNISHPLSEGDQIHLGAWTTITVRLER